MHNDDFERMNKRLTAPFNKFAGKEVEMVNTPFQYNGKSYDQLSIKENDPVAKAMHETAKRAGLSLRIWHEGMAGTCDFRTDRVNAHIQKEADGKFRIQPGFDVG